MGRDAMIRASTIEEYVRYLSQQGVFPPAIARAVADISYDTHRSDLLVAMVRKLLEKTAAYPKSVMMARKWAAYVIAASFKRFPVDLQDAPDPLGVITEHQGTCEEFRQTIVALTTGNHADKLWSAWRMLEAYLLTK